MVLNTGCGRTESDGAAIVCLLDGSLGCMLGLVGAINLLESAGFGPVAFERAHVSAVEFARVLFHEQANEKT
jgi:hypothetical protein